MRREKLTFLTSNLFFPSALTSVWAPDLELLPVVGALDGTGVEGPASGMSMSAIVDKFRSLPHYVREGGPLLMEEPAVKAQ